MNVDTFGEWVKIRRKRLDLTQGMLSQRVGCSLSAIRKIESDERRPSRQIAELLALHLEVPSEEKALFLKIARGESSINRLKSVSTLTEKLVGVSETFFPASNIPASTSPLIGRQQEFESLANMLTDPRQRLITILGPGGIGKTRLAMEAAGAHLATFDDHVYFIQLAAFNNSDAVLPAIAAIFNLHSTSTEELTMRLVDLLHDHKILLVLDNFEHLVDDAPQVSDLLQRIPQLKVLVTSRERLNLQGEWTFELSGLSVPPRMDVGKAVYSALQLFELHARRIRPDFKLTDKEREAVIRICQRVDGMPLAIELAAAWVNLLSCQEIAEEIERGFDFLSSKMRDIPERHRSLRAVFEHSWNRLTEQEQSILSGLSIFQGGFCFDAAEAVVGADRNVLSSLLSKSLLRRSPNGRFDLHDVIRQYAASYLKGESALRDSHSKHYLNLLYKGEVDPFGAESDIERIQDLLIEYGNLQLAWSHAIQQKMYDDIGRVLESSWLIYAINGWYHEGIGIAFDLIGSLRSKAKTRKEKSLLTRAMMSAIGHLARVGDLEQADQISRECTDILRAIGDIEHLSNVLFTHARIAAVLGNFSLAHTLANEGIELTAQHDNRWLRGLAHVTYGDICGLEGDYERAYELFQAGFAIYEELGNIHSMVAYALNKFAFVLIHLGRFDQAEQALNESLALNIRLQDQWGEGVAFGRMGLLALHREELSNANLLLNKSLALFNELGLRWDIAWTLLHLGKLSIAANDWSEAENFLKGSIKLSLVCHAMPQVIEAALELAECFIHTGKVNEAAELVYASIQHSSCTDAGKQRADKLGTVIKQKVDVDFVGDVTIETVVAQLI